MDSAGFYRRVLSGFAWQGASKIVVQSVSWISTVVVARLLDPHDYGIMAVASVFISVLIMVMEMGLSQGLIQKPETTLEEEDGVFWLSLLLGMLLYALLWAAAPHIAAFYDIEPLSEVLRVAGIALVIGSLKSVPLARTMRRLDFRYRAVVETGASLASVATVIVMAFHGFGYWSLVFGTLVQQSVTALGYLRSLRRMPRPWFPIRPLFGLIAYGARIMGSNMAYIVSSRADVFIIGKAFGEHLTGFYAMAYQLAMIPLDKIGTVFNHVAFPSLARVRDDLDQSRRLFLQMHRYLMVVAHPILLGLALVAQDAVEVLLTEKWLPIVPVLQALCLINAVRVSGMIVSPLLNSRGKAHLTFRYSMASMVLLPIAFLIGVQFGLIGVALAWLGAYPLLYAMLVRYAVRELAMRPGDLLASARPALMASAAMAASVLLFQSLGGSLSPALRLAASSALGAATYGAVFVLLFGEQLARLRQALGGARES